MTLRDDLIPVLDDVRALVDDLGLRQFTVQTRHRSWSGGELGRGTATDTDTEITPPPKVKLPGPRHQFAEPGVYEAGDLLLSKISATYDEDDLTGGLFSGGLSSTEEFFWLVNGDTYRVVRKPEQRNFEWRVHLRRVTGR